MPLNLQRVNSHRCDSFSMWMQCRQAHVLVLSTRKTLPPSFGFDFLCSLPASHVLVRSQIAERRVRPHGFRDFREIVELLLMVRCARSTCPFNRGERGGSTKSLIPSSAHAVPKVALKLRPAIDLVRPHRKAQPPKRLAQHALRGLTGQPQMRGQHILPADDIPGREVNPPPPRQGLNRRGIDRQQIPGIPSSQPAALREKALVDIHAASIAMPQGLVPLLTPNHPLVRVFRIYLNLHSTEVFVPVGAGSDWSFSTDLPPQRYRLGGR
jgi:hypothetical protein